MAGKPKRRRARALVSKATTYEFVCEWCGDGYSSQKERKVDAWAIRHLNAHIRRSVTDRTAELEESLERRR